MTRCIATGIVYIALFALAFHVKSSAASQEESRLCVFILNTKNENLTDVLTHLDANIAPWTPLDVYVICTQEHRQACLEHVNSLTLNETVVIVRTVQQTGWGAEKEGMDASRHRYSWWFNQDYRLMGDWRLWHMQHYAKKLGYRYVLQIDTDSSVRSNVSFNIVNHFKDNNIQMGYQTLTWDSVFVFYGLPELMRFYLLTEDLVPAGRLFQQCNPPNINGLHSTVPADGGQLEQKSRDAAKALGMPSEGGWTFLGPYGNFVILDLELWLSPPVQRFVKLCRVSGASMHFRWNEQAVYAAIWQMFIPEARSHVFSYMEYVHYHPAG